MQRRAPVTSAAEAIHTAAGESVREHRSRHSSLSRPGLASRRWSVRQRATKCASSDEVESESGESSYDVDLMDVEPCAPNAGPALRSADGTSHCMSRVVHGMPVACALARRARVREFGALCADSGMLHSYFIHVCDLYHPRRVPGRRARALHATCVHVAVVLHTFLHLVSVVGVFVGLADIFSNVSGVVRCVWCCWCVLGGCVSRMQVSHARVCVVVVLPRIRCDCSARMLVFGHLRAVSGACFDCNGACIMLMRSWFGPRTALRTCLACLLVRVAVDVVRSDAIDRDSREARDDDGDDKEEEEEEGEEGARDEENTLAPAVPCTRTHIHTHTPAVYSPEQSASMQPCHVQRMGASEHIERDDVLCIVSLCNALTLPKVLHSMEYRAALQRRPYCLARVPTRHTVPATALAPPPPPTHTCFDLAKRGLYIM